MLKSTYHGQTAVDMTSLVVHEITLVGSRCGPFPTAIALLRDNAIDVQSLIHKRFPIERGTEAFEYAAAKGRAEGVPGNDVVEALQARISL